MACCNALDFVDLTLLVLTCIIDCVLDVVEPVHIALICIVRIVLGFAVDLTASLIVYLNSPDIGNESPKLYGAILVISCIAVASHYLCLNLYCVETYCGKIYVFVHRFSFAWIKLISFTNMILIVYVSAIYASEVSSLGIFLYFVSGVDILMNFVEMCYLWVSLCCCKKLKIYPSAIINETKDRRFIRVEKLQNNDVQENQEYRF